MTPSYCLSSPRTSSPIHSLTNLARIQPNHSTPNTLFKLLQSSPNPILPLLRLKNSNQLISHTLATISSFAEGEEQKEDGKENENENENENELPGMAQAFHISSRTAMAISACMAVAALAVPMVMPSVGQGSAVKVKVKALSYMTLLFGFYMAWNIGANDVANAMGTSVGSGALTLTQAVITAGVLEFSGALLMGTHVTSTMQKGILVANVFQGRDLLLFAGLLSSLAAAGTWLQVYT